MNASKWWRRLSPQRPGRTLLLVLPYAGGSGNIAAGWAEDERFELHGAVLPGRDQRSGETPLEDLVAIAERLAAEWHGNRPTIIYGHSFGAWLGFEIARRLEARGEPIRLVAAGAVRAPHLRSRHAPLDRLDGPGLWHELASIVGSPPDGGEASAEKRAQLEPALRADLTAMARYTPAPGPLLAAPLLVVGGSTDTSVAAEELAAWASWTTATCRVRMVAGGHFFIHGAAGVTDLLADGST